MVMALVSASAIQTSWQRHSSMSKNCVMAVSTAFIYHGKNRNNNQPVMTALASQCCPSTSQLFPLFIYIYGIHSMQWWCCHYNSLQQVLLPSAAGQSFILTMLQWTSNLQWGTMLLPLTMWPVTALTLPQESLRIPMQLVVFCPCHTAGNLLPLPQVDV